MQLSRALVLTAKPGEAALSDGVLTGARGILAPFHVFDEGWLAPGEAWQALFAAGETLDVPALRGRIAATLTAALGSALGAAPLDVNIVPDDLAYRRKRLLAADMDSTIIAQELIDELAGHIGRRGEVERITAATMRGELDFEASLRERVRLFAGVPVGVLEDLARAAPFVAGAERLIGTMKRGGARTVLITGGFSIAAEIVAQRAGFDAFVANTLGVSNGRLTGDLRGPVLGSVGKREAMLAEARHWGIDPVLTLAVGDGANDIDMLAAAGLGVAFRATPKVQAAAASLSTGAVITHGDLSALLALQGYGA